MDNNSYWQRNNDSTANRVADKLHTLQSMNYTLDTSVLEEVHVYNKTVDSLKLWVKNLHHLEVS
jgi:hypothetical protein